MYIDLLLQIRESRELLLKHAFMSSCPELIIFMIRLDEFKRNEQEKLFKSIVEDFLQPDSCYELNLNYELKKNVYSKEDLNEIELEVIRMISNCLIPTFSDFIKSEYSKVSSSYDSSSRRPSKGCLL